jgi:hypothetical protein
VKIVDRHKDPEYRQADVRRVHRNRLNDHADRPQDVADRLAASIHIVEKAEQIPPSRG